MSWILVLFVHAGALSSTDSMALTTVPGFKSELVCQAAGKQAQMLGKNTTKDVKFVCLKQE